MRVSELYKQVAQLGFEDSLEDENRFYYAANRALLQVSTIRPAISAYVINHKPMENLIKENTFSPIERSEDLIFEATDAKAYYFEVDGTGSLYIEAQDAASGEWVIIGAQEFTSNRRFIPYKGFIKKDGSFTTGSVRLRFVGDYLYSVKNVAMYRHVYSNSVEDIPAYEPYTRYDISSLVPDFLSLNSPPISEDDNYERLNQGYDVEGGKVILLPYSTEGCFKVLYRRKPTEIENDGNASEDNAIIDLDEELCSILPILIASYVWVEDEPGMAEYYLTLYRERAMDIERRINNTAPVTIRNKNGW
jgi:hypothetical protein